METRRDLRSVPSAGAPFAPGVFRTDQAGRLVYVNDAFCAMADLDRGAAIGQDWLGAVQPDYRSTTREAWLAAIRADQPFRQLIGLSRSHASVRWVHAELGAEYAPTGEITGHIGVVVDVPVPESAEQGVQERFRAHYRTQPIPAYTWRSENDELRLMDYNDAAVLATKGHIQGLLGIEASELYAGSEVLDDLRRCVAGVSHFRKEMPYTFQTTGQTTWLAVTYAFVPPNMAVVYAEDIGERKAAEQKLEAQRQHLLDIINGMKVFVGLVSPDGVLLEANDAPLQAAGVQRADVIGRPFSDAYWWSYSPDVQAELRNALERTARGETVRYDVPIRVSDDRRITIDVTFSPLWGADGRVVQIVGSAVDITERKLAEEALRQSVLEKSLLLREVHHRVKNNLQLVSSLLYFQEQVAPTPDVRRLFHASRNRVRAMATIHESVLESADLNRVDFPKYVTNVASALLSGYEHERHKVRLLLDVTPSQLGIQIAVPCGLILNELVTNAIKYAFPGEQAGVISITFRQSETGWCRLSVSDNGIGLPEAVEPGAATTLGMRLIYALANQLGANLSVAREAGTRFDLEFGADRG